MHVVVQKTPIIHHAVKGMLLITGRPHILLVLCRILTKPCPVALSLTYARLDGVLPGPLAGRRFVAGPVGLVDMCDLGNERVIRVWVRQHRTNTQQHFGDGESRAPLVSQNVQADAAIRVDVWVVNAGGEVDLRGLEGVVGGEMDR